MTHNLQTKYIRVVVFDDEPGLLEVALREIQEELLTSHNVQVRFQLHRMDWLWQARYEIEHHFGRIPLLWLIDLHQHFKLPKELVDAMRTEIEEFAVGLRGTIKELLTAKEDNAVSSFGGETITPDGAVIIAKARERNIPFFIVSKYSQDAFTAPLLSKLATGEVSSNAPDWALKKSGDRIDETSCQNLKVRIAQLAKPATHESSNVDNQQDTVVTKAIQGWKSALKVDADRQTKVFLKIATVISVLAVIAGAILVAPFVKEHWDVIHPMTVIAEKVVVVLVLIALVLLGWRFPDARPWGQRQREKIANRLYNKKARVLLAIESILSVGPNEAVNEAEKVEMSSPRTTKPDSTN